MSAASTLRPAAGRVAYAGIDLYAPDRTPCRIDLSDNTNRHGLPPAAAAAIRDADSDSFTRYPDLYASQLKAALGTYTGVPANCVVTGCGSDDVLDSAIRAFAEPGESIAYCTPTFPMIPIFARMNGLNAIGVAHAPGFALNIDALVETGARIIYVCSPNNPTGVATPVEAIDQLIERAPGFVVIDEAYVEYAGPSFVQRAAEHERVLVTRTMSKAFGLAGLRIGYAIGAPEVVAEVEKSRGPYKVSTIAQQAALAVLRDESGWVAERVASDIRSRDRLFAELRSSGLSPIASRANFVLVPIPRAGAVAATMRANGVAVRAFTGLEGVGDALRISVGPWPLIEECLASLRSALRVTQ